MASKKNNTIDSVKREGYRKRTSSGEIQKWQKGMEVEGEIAGIRKGLLGSLLDMRGEDGEVTSYSCPTVLLNAVEGIPHDVTILIVCTGTKPSARYPGKEMYLFDVYEKGSE